MAGSSDCIMSFEQMTKPDHPSTVKLVSCAILRAVMSVMAVKNYAITGV